MKEKATSAISVEGLIPPSGLTESAKAMSTYCFSDRELGASMASLEMIVRSGLLHGRGSDQITIAVALALLMAERRTRAGMSKPSDKGNVFGFDAAYWEREFPHLSFDSPSCQCAAMYIEIEHSLRDFSHSRDDYARIWPTVTAEEFVVILHLERAWSLEFPDRALLQGVRDFHRLAQPWHFSLERRLVDDDHTHTV